MHKKLFIPGPIDVKQDVLEQMTRPMIGHRSKEASILQRSISEKLQEVFYTKEQILLSTSSGSGLMEGAIRSCTRKKAAVFSVGAFGDRWYKMAASNNVPSDKFTVEPGEATKPEAVDEALATGKYDLITITHNETSTGVMNPVEEISKVMKKYPEVIWCLDAVSSMAGTKIEVDKLGVDICITSTQKCFGMPPGMAAASMSKKAVEAAKQVKYRGVYLDLLELYEYIQKKDHQYPSTPAIPIMYAMDYQLDKILSEGLEKRFARHLEMAQYVRAWAKKNFEIFPKEEYTSNTLTTVKNTRGIDVASLNRELGSRGYAISNGYGDLKEKTFRISHMGDYTLDDVKGLIQEIDDILGK
ncbi:pyridoxal-phosphate-dependent aminotransferase family protein [Lutispora sp.]|uniref:pyridoxal-phosphate-dependent aminotransferase family protein n=1 Tax=Lutispora sp. TaxID=2828727 RepID=UPI000EEB750A|nr:alanine--glyoxylate aminotransferase family protein [Lutispora sp.]MEA4962981.1 alanine--glyoxylate aminotransferase family protein [Lutispora sp.]HCJ58445.1 aminotransferase [Clostridiaceae bacterium]